jgi:hypothetical protein
MVVLGIDAHKRTHTVVAVDEVDRQLGVQVTVATSTAAHLELVVWAGRFGGGTVVRTCMPSPPDQADPHREPRRGTLNGHRMIDVIPGGDQRPGKEDVSVTAARLPLTG